MDFSRHAGRRLTALGTDAEWSSVAPGSTGDAQDKALEIGARISDSDLSAAFWRRLRTLAAAPCRSQAVFPHFVLDRGKPGTWAVDSHGRRFVNEAITYHQFALAMLANASRRSRRFLCPVCGGRAEISSRHGASRRVGNASGDCRRIPDRRRYDRATCAEINIDPGNLRETVDRMNDYARTGRDLEFARETTVYQNHNGDAAVGPNPLTLGRIATAPFYALRLYPSDIGTSAGLVTDACGRILDYGGRPIAGLYCCGNDMQSMMGGTYPGTRDHARTGYCLRLCRCVGRDPVDRITEAPR